MKRYLIMTLLACATLATSSHVAAQTQLDNLGTVDNHIEWLVSGGNAFLAPSFQTNVNRFGAISITETAFMNGDFAKGGNLSQFNGFWIAQNDFLLPQNAVNLVMEFDGFYANDRG
ncbi:MAG: hypothetical protein AAGA30_19690 [Planctomycetota bacterium]